MLEAKPPVDSENQPPPSDARRKLRPWYLVVAMVLTWFFGVQGLTSGCNAALLLREGTRPDVATAAANARGATDAAQFINAAGALGAAVAVDAMQEARRVVFPLSIAQVLLSGLLVVASGIAMSGRRGGRALALQAIAANAVLATVYYVLTRSIRAAHVDAIVNAALQLPDHPELREAVGNPAGTWLQITRDLVSSPAFGWWSHRIRFGFFELGTLALGALALTRPRTKAFFDAVARQTESQDE